MGNGRQWPSLLVLLYRLLIHSQKKGRVLERSIRQRDRRIATNLNKEELERRIKEEVSCMGDQKINVEMIVFSVEADLVVAGLNSAIDRLEETCTIFVGGIENVPVVHSGTRTKSAVRHMINAGNVVTSAVQLAAQDVAHAYKKAL
jgi:hypothetical protein